MEITIQIYLYFYIEILFKNELKNNLPIIICYLSKVFIFFYFCKYKILTIKSNNKYI